MASTFSRGTFRSWRRPSSQLSALGKTREALGGCDPPGSVGEPAGERSSSTDGRDEQMALITRIRSRYASHRSESARRRLRDRRGLKLGALLLLASLVVLVPVAAAALDPTDAVCDGTGMLASEFGGFNNTACGFNALNQHTAGSFNTAAGGNA